MQQPIEPKNDYTTDELYIIYNSIDFSKEHPNIVAYITQTNTEEQKVSSYNESLSKKLRFRMMRYKSETEYLDTTTKTGYIQENLSAKFTPIKHVLGTPYERIENQSDRSADRLFKKFLEVELNRLRTSTNNATVEEPEFNANFWNKECYNLFNYLNENYDKEGNIKYINIYYFLKQNAKDQRDTYRFKMRIDKDYKPLIKCKFNLTLTKFAKAEYGYDDKELPILKDLEKKFQECT